MAGYEPVFSYSQQAKALYVASKDAQNHYSLGIIDFTNARTPQAFPYPETSSAWRSSPQIALSPDGKRLYTLRSRIHAAQISPASIPRGTVVTDLDASYEELVLFTFDLPRMAFLPVRLPAESSQFGADQSLLDWRPQTTPFRVHSTRRGETYLIEPGRIIRQKGNQSAEFPIDPAPDGHSLRPPALGGDDQFLFVPVGPGSYGPAEKGKWSLRTYLTDPLRKMSEVPSPRPIFQLQSNGMGSMFFDNLAGKMQIMESTTLGLLREIVFDGEEVTSIYVVP
jgi:hypothetical protein